MRAHATSSHRLGPGGRRGARAGLRAAGPAAGWLRRHPRGGPVFRRARRDCRWGGGVVWRAVCGEGGRGPYLAPPVAVSMQDADVAALLPRPARDADKYRRGVVGVVAGSPGYPGAAVLAAEGAVAGGAGLVRFV